MIFIYVTFVIFHKIVDTTFIVNSVMSRLFDKNVNDWHNCLSLEISVSGRGGNKLRTYRLFKNSFETEIYCKIALSFSHRSAFAKFKCGVAPLRIETGRFENLRIEERICCLCSDLIEDETHF